MPQAVVISNIHDCNAN